MSYVDRVGTEGDDTLVIEAGDFGRLRGLGGDDVLRGASGDDILEGGDGEDELYGNDGNDTLVGGAGNDFIDGGEGYDIVDFSFLTSGITLSYSSSQVLVTAAFGMDTLYGVEAIRGTAFNDEMTGSRLITLLGGDGNDILRYGEVMEGGAGDDLFVAPGGYYNDHIGGDGFDVVDYSGFWVQPEAFAGVTVDLNHTVRQRVTSLGSSSSQWWYKDFDLLLGIEGLIGSARQDTFTGTAGDEKFWGGAADDVLQGRGGDDLLDGGHGLDFTSYVNADAAVTVDLRIVGGQAIGGGQGVDTLVSIENVMGGQFNDRLTGDALANVLWGEIGDDQLQGGAGDDLLRGGLGDDLLDGGEGVDMVDFRDPAKQPWALYNDDPGVNITLSGLQNAGELGVDSLVNIEGAHGSYLDDVMTGDAGANVFEGHSGRDVIYGMDGADRIWGGGDVDTIYGGAGDDWIYSGSNGPGSANWSFYPYTPGDVMHGEDGNDIIWGNAGEQDVFYGGEGNDQLRDGYGGDMDWMQGGHGDDLLDGGEDGSDYADFSDAEGALAIDLRITVAQSVGGGLGRDTLVNIENLVGGRFNDVLKGTDGYNVLIGGEGDDTLSGFGGPDLYGVGQGRDVVTDFTDETQDTTGGGGDEFIVEGHTEYLSVAQQGADVFVDFGGGDTLLVRNTTVALIDIGDFIFSQTGTGANEVLVGGLYRDQITGGDGSDVISGGHGGNELDGGAGYDWVDYSGVGAGVLVSIGAWAESSGVLYDNLVNFEAVRGSAHDDTIYGDDGDNFVEGGAGNDWVAGWNGDDTYVFGVGSGHDQFSGFVAGGGEDRIQVTGYGSYQSIEQVGADTLITFSATDSILLLDVQASSVTAEDFVWGRAYADRASQAGTEGDESLEGTEGSDRIDAWSGNDVVDGRGGADFLYGGYGDDRLTGGAGNDLLDGGDGTDTADYSATAQAISVNLSLVSAQGTGGSGVDTLLSIENLFGGLGGDTLTGSAGVNVLRGNGGHDVVSGGKGDDLLNGGQGNDVFVFAAGDGHDVIEDFTAGGSDDRINVSGFSGYSLSQVGADTLVAFDANNTILLKFVQAESLTAADFNITAAPNVVMGTQAGEALDGTAEGDRIEGLGGDDSLRGMGGADTMLGGEGDDLLDGGVGDDTLDGGAGNDTADYHTATSAVTVSLALAGAQNTVGAGFDTLAGIENLIGGFGDDQLTGDGDANRLAGGGGADRLDGGAGDDLLTGGAGADTLIGGSGHDRASYAAAAAAISVNLATGVHTGEAAGDTFSGVEEIVLTGHADTFTGSAGADGADGGAGNDALIGAGGDDVLSGGHGGDRLVGGAGNDALNGGEGIDQADYRGAATGVIVNLAAGTATGEGSDTLTGVENVQGSAFADSLTGDAGANSLNGHAGNDVLSGAEGNDILVGGAGADVLNGGAGLDYASYISATAGVSVNLLTGVHTGDAAGDAFTSVERFRLSAQADSFQGNALTNYAYGAEGSDTLRGGAGFDRLYGEEGADQLFGEADNDVLIGGAGADAIDGGAGKDGASYETATGAVGVNLQSLSHTGDATGDAFTSVEFFILSAHADSFTGGSAGDEAQGGAGNDTLMGNGGADWLRGQDGADVLLGGVGEDILEGGAGADQLNGGDGIDYASYLKAVGIDLSTGVHTGEATGDSFNSVERFRLSGYDDSFFGSAGDDWVAGYAGNDTLNGGDGNDTLNGGFSSDVLIGGAGADKLIGELGNDTLTGGAGSDAFQVTAAGFGADVVTDFGAGDYIRVTGIAGVDDISDLTISQQGAHTLITFPDGSSITLNGVSAATIDANDFSFG